MLINISFPFSSNKTIPISSQNSSASTKPRSVLRIKHRQTGRGAEMQASAGLQTKMQNKNHPRSTAANLRHLLVTRRLSKTSRFRKEPNPTETKSPGSQQGSQQASKILRRVPFTLERHNQRPSLSQMFQRNTRRDRGLHPERPEQNLGRKRRHPRRGSAR